MVISLNLVGDDVGRALQPRISRRRPESGTGSLDGGRTFIFIVQAHRPLRTASSRHAHRAFHAVVIWCHSTGRTALPDHVTARLNVMRSCTRDRAANFVQSFYAPVTGRCHCEQFAPKY